MLACFFAKRPDTKVSVLVKSACHLWLLVLMNKFMEMIIENPNQIQILYRFMKRDTFKLMKEIVGQGTDVLLLGGFFSYIHMLVMRRFCLFVS